MLNASLIPASVTIVKLFLTLAPSNIRFETFCFYNLLCYGLVRNH